MKLTLHKVLVTSTQQIRDTLKHKFVRKMAFFSPKDLSQKHATTNKRLIQLLNPLTKLQDFLNNTRNLQEMVTIHGRKK